MKKLFREIRKGENKEDYLAEIKKICRIHKGRRFYGRNEKFYHLVWNINFPNDPIEKFGGYTIHHKNFNKLCDEIYNLEKLTRSEHTRLHSLHRHPSEKTRLKMSKARSGKKHSQYGKHRSEETKRKISVSLKGRKLSKNEIERRKTPISANFKNYNSIKEAAEDLFVSTTAIIYRIKTKKPGYFYIERRINQNV